MCRVALAASIAVAVSMFCGASAAASEMLVRGPLPAHSLAANGAPQKLIVHPSHGAAPLALPPAHLHRHAAAGLQLTYGGTPIDVTTYHYDTLRTGWNPSETDLTVTDVSASSFGQLATLNVDGTVFAQPLIISNYTLPGGATTDVLLVVTAHDQVYAFDARNNYALLWQQSMGFYQSTNDVGCGDVQDGYGISSTPVIVRNGAGAATVYLVAATEPAPYSFHTQVHALDLGTGLDITTPVEIAPRGHLASGGSITLDPQNQWNRAGLAYANGSLYIGIGSHCDNNASQISGWLLSYSPSLALQHAFHTIQASASLELSSIWMTGFAPAIASNGNVFVATGNGNYNRTPHAVGFGESVLSLSPSLQRVNSAFTPANFNDLNGGDVDFGSGGVMLLPSVSGQKSPDMAVALGKAGTLYLLNQKSLGGENAGDTGALQSFAATGGVWGGPAYYGAAGGGLVYYQGDGDVLHAYQVNRTRHPSLTSFATGNSGGGYGGSLPIVSSNGTAAGTAVVWLIRRSSSVQLEAYDAVNLGTPLYQANAGTWSNPGQSNPFVTPLEANGRVYVPAWNTVTVFGLTSAPGLRNSR